MLFLASLVLPEACQKLAISHAELKRALFDLFLSLSSGETSPPRYTGTERLGCILLLWSFSLSHYWRWLFVDWFRLVPTWHTKIFEQLFNFMWFYDKRLNPHLRAAFRPALSQSKGQSKGSTLKTFFMVLLAHHTLVPPISCWPAMSEATCAEFIEASRVEWKLSFSTLEGLAEGVA